MLSRRIIPVLLILALLTVVACQDNPAEDQAAPETGAVVEEAVAATAPVVETFTPTPAATDTPQPTPTPTEPLAAMVNGAPVFLADYEQEVARYETAQRELGIDPATTPGYKEQVLNALIERELILQAATAAGVVITPEQVDQKLADLRTAAGDAANFDAWLASNQWTEEEFRQALAAEMVTEQMVTRVTADVPEAMEQVRARYIQVDDAALAQSLLDRARAGDDFAFLAQQNSLDRITGEFGGDLGFFAPGSLLVPEVEAAAFALQPGEISEVIAAVGQDGVTHYYIVQTTERDPNRALTADERFTLLQGAFEAWLDRLWEQATVERFVAP